MKPTINRKRIMDGCTILMDSNLVTLLSIVNCSGLNCGYYFHFSVSERESAECFYNPLCLKRWLSFSTEAYSVVVLDYPTQVAVETEREVYAFDDGSVLPEIALPEYTQIVNSATCSRSYTSLYEQLGIKTVVVDRNHVYVTGAEFKPSFEDFSRSGNGEAIVFHRHLCTVCNASFEHAHAVNFEHNVDCDCKFESPVIVELEDAKRCDTPVVEPVQTLVGSATIKQRASKIASLIKKQINQQKVNLVVVEEGVVVDVISSMKVLTSLQVGNSSSVAKIRVGSQTDVEEFKKLCDSNDQFYLITVDAQLSTSVESLASAANV